MAHTKKRVTMQIIRNSIVLLLFALCFSEKIFTAGRAEPEVSTEDDIELTKELCRITLAGAFNNQNDEQIKNIQALVREHFLSHREFLPDWEVVDFDAKPKLTPEQKLDLFSRTCNAKIPEEDRDTYYNSYDHDFKNVLSIVVKELSSKKLIDPKFLSILNVLIDENLQTVMTMIGHYNNKDIQENAKNIKQLIINQIQLILVQTLNGDTSFDSKSLGGKVMLINTALLHQACRAKNQYTSTFDIDRLIGTIQFHIQNYIEKVNSIAKLCSITLPEFLAKAPAAKIIHNNEELIAFIKKLEEYIAELIHSYAHSEMSWYLEQLSPTAGFTPVSATTAEGAEEKPAASSRPASRIQAMWKGYKARRAVAQRKADERKAAERRTQAATTMQRVWRGKAARNKVDTMRAEAAAPRPAERDLDTEVSSESTLSMAGSGSSVDAVPAPLVATTAATREPVARRTLRPTATRTEASESKLAAPSVALKRAGVDTTAAWTTAAAAEVNTTSIGDTLRGISEAVKIEQERLVNEILIPTLTEITKLTGVARFNQMNRIALKTEFTEAERKLNDYGKALLKTEAASIKDFTTFFTEATRGRINTGSALERVVNVILE